MLLLMPMHRAHRHRPGGPSWWLAALLGGSLLLDGCADPEQRAADYLNRAEALLARDRPDKAQLEFRNALHLDPANITARFGLARAQLANRRWREAAHALRAVLELDPNHRPALVELGRLYLQAGDGETAAHYADRILAASPEHPDGRALRAGALLLAGDAAGALRDLEAVLREMPDHRDAIALAARAQHANGDAGAAVDRLRRWIERNPDDLALRGVLVGILEALGDIDGVIAARTELGARDRDDLPHRLALAQYLLTHGQPERAEAELVTAVRLHPEDIVARRAYLDLLREQHGAEHAVAEIERLIEADPDALPLRFELGRIHLDNENWDAAREVLGEIRDSVPGRSSVALAARTRLAVAAARTGRVDEALRLIDAVLADNPRDREALLLRGTLQLNAGNARAAIADFRMVQRVAGEDPNLRRLLARAHLANDEDELAIDQLRKAVANAPDDPRLRQDLAELYLELDHVDGAIDELNAALRLSGDDFEVVRLRCRAHARAGAWQAALRDALRLQELRPESASGFHQAGLIQLELNDADAARRDFTAALEREPDAVQPLTMLVRLYRDQDQPASALSLLRETLGRYPGHYAAHQLLGELLLETGAPDEARRHFESAIAARPSWETPYANLARVLLASGDSAAAAATLDRGIIATGGAATLHAQRAALRQP